LEFFPQLFSGPMPHGPGVFFDFWLHFGSLTVAPEHLPSP
jgi:hypothetical protein